MCGDESFILCLFLGGSSNFSLLLLYEIYFVLGELIECRHQLLWLPFLSVVYASNSSNFAATGIQLFLPGCQQIGQEVYIC